MADTTNFAWTKPTVSGSSGAWGTILNDLFDSIDADLQTVKDNADVAAAENLDIPLHLSFFAASSFPTNPAISGSSTLAGIQLLVPDDETGQRTWVLPIHGLKAGMNITGFRSRGLAEGLVDLTVTLRYITETGSVVLLDTLVHSNSTLATSTETLGTPHTVVANRLYYFEIQMTRNAGSDNDTAQHVWAQPLVERA